MFRSTALLRFVLTSLERGERGSRDSTHSQRLTVNNERWRPFVSLDQFRRRASSSFIRLCRRRRGRAFAGLGDLWGLLSHSRGQSTSRRFTMGSRFRGEATRWVISSSRAVVSCVPSSHFLPPLTVSSVSTRPFAATDRAAPTD